MLPESTQSADYRAPHRAVAHPLSPADELLLAALVPVVAFLVAAAAAALVLALFRPGFAFGSDDIGWQTACAHGLHAASVTLAKA